MKFSDHADREVPEPELLDVVWNGPPAGLEEWYDDVVPTGSINDFLNKNSYGVFSLNATITNWTVTDNTEAHYAFGLSGLTRRLGASMFPLLDQLDEEGMDFGQFDLDEDMVIDSVVLLHSGYAAELGGHDCYTHAVEQDRIWSHAITTFANEWVSRSGYQIASYSVASAMRGTCHDRPSYIGVMTHEFIHSWGIPDLYDTTKSGGKGIGTYDVMSNPYGVDGAQTHPNHLSPWSKMRIGWLEPIEICEDGRYIIEASALTPDVYIIKKNFPAGEYLLIENRQPIDWDEKLYDGGIVIWHIDDAMDRNNRRGYPGQPGWPGNGNHYQVAFVSPDRRYDLEKGHNLGDWRDFWVVGEELGPGPFETEASDPFFYPNTNSYQNGHIFPTGIRIYDFTKSGTVMGFSVSGLTPQTSPPTSVVPTTSRPPSSEPSVAPTVSAAPSPAPTLTGAPSRSGDPPTGRGNSSDPGAPTLVVSPPSTVPPAPQPSPSPASPQSPAPSPSSSSSRSEFPSIFGFEYVSVVLAVSLAMWMMQ